ncbi:MAG: hypothetical protein EHM48_08845, partial [Planctomycetaceae bacterium]
SDAPTVITGDDASRTIIVSAAADKHELIAQVIKEIDDAQAQSGSVATIKVYRIQNTDAASIATALLRVLSDTGATGNAGGRNPRGGNAGASAGLTRISADTGSNAIVVRASQDEHERIAKLLEELDKSPGSQLAIQTITLQNADAANVAAMLTRLFAGGGATRVRGQAAPAQTQTVLIEGDRGGKLLTVRADDETFKKIQEVAMKLDDAAKSGAVETRIVALKNAQAASVAPALAAAFAPKTGGGRNAVPNPDDVVTVVAEPMSNSLLVTASAANMVKVEAIIAQMEIAPDNGMKTDFYVCKNIRSADMAAALAKVTANTGLRIRGAGQQQGLTVSSEPTSNAIIASGPAADIEKLWKIVKSLDDAGTETGTTTHIIPLKNGDALTMAGMVKDLYAQANKTNKNPEPLAVSADERANAIVLQCSKDTYDKVNEWVAKVEEMKPAKGNLRIITLPTADPTEVDNAIRQMFNGDSTPATPARTGQPANNPPRRTGPAVRGARGSDKVETTVLAQQKAILVNANDEDYETILKLVAKMEEAALAAKRDIKVFTLKNTSNTRVAAAIDALYRVAGRTPAIGDQVTLQAMPQT